LIVIIKLGRVVKVHTEQLRERIDIVTEALLSIVLVDLVIAHTFGQWGSHEIIIFGVSAGLAIYPL
jgi:hypothetical protein